MTEGGSRDALLEELRELRRALAQQAPDQALIGAPRGPGGLTDDYACLAEAAADLLLELSDTGRILYCSPSARELMGCKPEELIGSSAFEWIHPVDRSRIMQVFGEALEHSVNSGPQLRLLRPDGGAPWFEIKGRRCYTPEGDFRFVLILRDISDRVRLSEEVEQRAEHLEREVAERTEQLRTVQRRLAQAYRAGAAEAASAVLAHVIYNPLTALRGNLELLRSDPRGELVERAIQITRRIEFVVDEALATAGRHQLNAEKTEAGDLLDDVSADMSAACSKGGVTLEFDLAQDLPQLFIDRSLLGAAIDGVIQNSIEALPTGGHICVSIRGLEGGEAVEISLADSGPGFTPEALDHLPEEFYTTKPSGTGLGLTILSEVVRGHAGRLKLANASAGTGAVVRIELPAGELGPFARSQETE